MARTAYCKKCGREVTPGELCPYCGTRLGKTAVHAAWVLERRPVTDWMCWNAVMRVLLPSGVGVLALVLVLEGLAGGTEALERLFRGDFLWTLGGLLLGILAAVVLILALQGKDLMDYAVDSRGIHVTRYLPEPTALKLLVRGKPPALLAGADPEGKVLRLDQRDLAWKDVARVQLWPEKDYVLFYAPAWWMRLSVRCTPFSWEDVLEYIREKLGKKKKVRIPESLRAAPEKRAAVKPSPAGAFSVSDPYGEHDRNPDGSFPESGFSEPDAAAAGEQLSFPDETGGEGNKEQAEQKNGLEENLP